MYSHTYVYGQTHIYVHVYLCICVDIEIDWKIFKKWCSNQDFRSHNPEGERAQRNKWKWQDSHLKFIHIGKKKNQKRIGGRIRERQKWTQIKGHIIFSLHPSLPPPAYLYILITAILHTCVDCPSALYLSTFTILGLWIFIHSLSKNQ